MSIRMCYMSCVVPSKLGTIAFHKGDIIFWLQNTNTCVSLQMTFKGNCEKCWSRKKPQPATEFLKEKYVQYCNGLTVILFQYYSVGNLVEKETGQAIATMAETNEGSTTDEEHFHSEYLKKISD